MMEIEIRLLGPYDERVLDRIASDVFDRPIDPELEYNFLNDPRHHLAVAIDSGLVVGMASAVDYIHPDKPRQLWINEVGVSSFHRRLGIAKRLLGCLLEHGKMLGCTEAWVLTNRSNAAAMRLYESQGGVVEQDDTVMFSFKFEEELLFSYGTLQTEPVQLDTFGRRLDGTPDQLPGYTLTMIPIHKPDVAALIGATHTRNARRTAIESDVIEGTVFRVTMEELERSDEYEKLADYERVRVTLKSGLKAWVYSHSYPKDLTR